MQYEEFSALGKKSHILLDTLRFKIFVAQDSVLKLNLRLSFYYCYPVNKPWHMLFHGNVLKVCFFQRYR